MQEVDRARSRAWFSAGSSMAARIAMMAITTRSSIKVNLLLFIILLRLYGSVWTAFFMTGVLQESRTTSSG